jgi:hypothetical protein
MSLEAAVPPAPAGYLTLRGPRSSPPRGPRTADGDTTSA